MSPPSLSSLRVSDCRRARQKHRFITGIEWILNATDDISMFEWVLGVRQHGVFPCHWNSMPLLLSDKQQHIAGQLAVRRRGGLASCEEMPRTWLHQPWNVRSSFNIWLWSPRKILWPIIAFRRSSDWSRCLDPLGWRAELSQQQVQDSSGDSLFSKHLCYDC